MYTTFPGTTTSPSPLAGAALLVACGCPRAEVADGTAVRPDGFDDWGVAVIGAGVVIDGDGGLHAGDCSRPSPCPERARLTLADLSRIIGRTCLCGSDVQLAVAPSAPAASSLLDVTYGFHHLLLDFPLAAPGVSAQRRALRFGHDAALILERFGRDHTPPPVFRDAIARCAALMRAYSGSGADDLRRDGLLRLETLLAAEFASGEHAASGRGRLQRARRQRSALTAAEAAVRGAAGGEVVCFFRQLPPLIDAARAAAPIAASALLDRWFSEIAVVVLPRNLAVLLHAHVAAADPSAGQPLAFTAETCSGVPGLASACVIAAQLWASGTEPQTAWSAARAASI